MSSQPPVRGQARGEGAILAPELVHEAEARGVGRDPAQHERDPNGLQHVELAVVVDLVAPHHGAEPQAAELGGGKACDSKYAKRVSTARSR
jgi:hypothetical protein